MNKTVKGLFDFIEKSPSQFHVVENQRKVFLAAGFEELTEANAWKLKLGGNYFVTRNGSSILAFRMPKKEYKSFMIMASHSDSPTFRIKEMPEMKEGKYVKLNTERYGGMLMAPWFDRPLSIAGRAIVHTGEGKIETKLVNLDRDLCMLPSLAIHMNREANDGYKYNAQKDLLPLISMEEKFNLKELVAESLEVKAENIIGSDLFLYNRDAGRVWGAKDEFISIGRLDDLQCSYSSMMGLVNAKNNDSAVQIHVTFDNEEVGSGTKQGADSTFLYDALVRINEAMEGNNSKLLEAIANSFMVSADNAHALHPNYSEKSDPTNKVYMNDGVVIKFNANQKYMTDGLAFGIFTEICKKAKVPFQTFVNRSDVAGGSTLGNISNAHVSINGVDIGLAQLAMHSPYETAGVKDTEYLLKIATKFYETVIESKSADSYTLK
ncbi:M18 family aminopeptidase [Pseudobutyrivibrio xylanivorans]|uniref:M18 family aminopeptidase n=1 Tax=Pseudobutyrivibrio xylanivorans TaxID=185007 RepID=A0A5P6VMW7_PSEXY|nr:M18 family aminopeptidase [Pseudobutyrivibrio xylanivorans]QFJ53698.1 M18 family aminopeptidase [Pseudobutyrivibrio xylanivorans]